MFLEFYGFREQPFGVTPNPRFLYLSSIHRHVLSSLTHAIECDLGFSALIAEPGLGKTTLLFSVLEKYRTSARTALLFTTQCTSPDLLRFVASDLGINPERDPVLLHDQLRDVLVREVRSGRRVLVVIDEAHNLAEPVLETVRLLSDFETPTRKLLHIILSGQLLLATKLGRPELTQLFQRIAVVNTLLPLNEEESRSYIDHRLRLAGHGGNGLFTAEAIEAILHHSGGVPRKINRVCFNALSRGCESGTRVIDEGIVQQVSLELDITPLVQARESKLAQAKNSASRTRIHIARQRLQPRVPIARQPASSAVQPAASILPLPPSLPPKDGVANRPTPALPTAASKAIEAVASVSARLMRRARKSPPYVRYALAVVVLCAAGALVFRTSTTAGAYVAAREVEKVPITYPAALQPGHVDREIVSDLAGREVRDDRSGATEDRAAAPSVARRAHAFVVAALDDATIRQPDTVPEDELSEPVSPPPVVNAGADDGHIRGIVATSVASDPVLASSAYSGGKLRRRVLPTYPPWAKQSRIEGTVVLNANVTPGGKVENIKVLSGNAALAQAAIEAVAHWRYEPFRVGGKPVAGETLIRVNFKLSQVRP